MIILQLRADDMYHNVRISGLVYTTLKGFVRQILLYSTTAIYHSVLKVLIHKNIVLFLLTSLKVVKKCYKK